MKAGALLFLVLFASLCTVGAYAQTEDLVGVVMSGTPQDVQTAIDKGADINFQKVDTGFTPLIAAAKKDTLGNTARSCAEYNSQLEGSTALKELEKASF